MESECLNDDNPNNIEWIMPVLDLGNFFLPFICLIIIGQGGNCFE